MPGIMSEGSVVRKSSPSCSLKMKEMIMPGIMSEGSTANADSRSGAR